MLRLIETNKLGLDWYVVICIGKNKENTTCSIKEFPSERGARTYIGSTYPHLKQKDIDMENIEEIPLPQAQKDTIIASQLRVEKALGRIFALGLQYDFVTDLTEFQAVFANGFVDIGGYNRHLVMLMGSVRY